MTCFEVEKPEDPKKPGLIQRRCLKEIKITKYSSTYCQQIEDHLGPCDLPPTAVSYLPPPPSPIPCGCMDCKIRRRNAEKQNT